MLRLSMVRARRLAVAGQLLSAPRPTSLLSVAEHLGFLQMDPVEAVARAERLVLWSRLGAYDVADLDRAAYRDRTLFEYRACLVPTSDYDLHRVTMRRYPPAGSAYARWLAENASFRRYVLSELRRRGPLRSRDFADRAVVPWRSGGWNDGKNVGRMLDVLWSSGAIAVVGRDSRDRIWDLAQRHYPRDRGRHSSAEIAESLLLRQLHSRAPARDASLGHALFRRLEGWERHLNRLVRTGVAVPFEVDGLAGRWYAHAEALDALPNFVARTTVLSPFDRLIYNRDRTEELFDFSYRLEMYMPVARRRYGYYVLPILHGHDLVGRLDPLFDRAAGRLTINAVYAEPAAPADAGPAVAQVIVDLARWLGAKQIAVGKQRPAIWDRALGGIG
jgi:uncharacterized protein YcaQ